MEPRQRLVGTVALVLAGLLAVGTVVAVVAAGRSGDWVLASSGAVLTAAAASQWGAVRARARGGRLLVGEVALLVGLGAVALVLCGVDFVTGERDARAFTVLFAAALVAIVGGVVGTYARSSRSGPDRPS
ncbi:hypothetical protein [Microlunatus flavus]|uniref:Uncharacterized protein n=1 Tax=Microlunatus flavus TaxID=1036181 RepID=A0A1H9HIN5_9ACTN|nr:hypothetical protein [Microlunatus flavus]SEQ62092.1 hypothetical protein SAMN05421756_104267 [Microlunatus flavus]